MKILIELIGPTQSGKTYIGTKLIEEIKRLNPNKTINVKKTETDTIERLVVSYSHDK